MCPLANPAAKSSGQYRVKAANEGIASESSAETSRAIDDLGAAVQSTAV